ncbi:MAG: hypothetical protein PUC95_06435 [Gemmiger formicilis]|nr:hypothetical protein [Gemmiger formicilis]
MKKSVRSVRQRLGSLVKPIFFDNAFEVKYKICQEKYLKTDSDALLFLDCYSKSGIALIQELSQKLRDPKSIKKTVDLATSESAAWMFLAYHTVTADLSTLDPSTSIQVPESDGSFFLHMFLSFSNDLFAGKI